jgi:hypothetical protein
VRTLILLVAATVLLGLGGEGLYHAVKSRQPVAVGCDQFPHSPPTSHRVRIAGCEIDYAGSGYRESGGEIYELLLPARPPGTGATAAPIVAVIRDPSALALVQSVVGGGRTPTPGQSVAVMREVVNLTNTSIEINGLVRAGLIARLRSHRILSGLSTPMDPNVAVVDVGATPNLLRPTLALAAGLLLALGPMIFGRRSRVAIDSTSASALEAAEAEPATDFTAPPPAMWVSGPAATPVDLPRRAATLLPRLLLLNLEVSDGPEAIETAPPLGTRDGVIAILYGLIPDLHRDESARVLTRHDGSIKLDLGVDDPVRTVVVEARGEAGGALAKEVLNMTGWRAFAPKTGLFVTVDELDALTALATDDS